MYYIIGFVLVVATAWGVGFCSANAWLRQFARVCVVLMAVAALVGTGFCLVYPIFNREAGVLIIPAFILALLTWMLFYLWAGLCEREDYFLLSGGARVEADRRQLTDTVQVLEQSLARSRAKAGGFFVSAARRRRLLLKIIEDEGLLHGMKVLQERHEAHVQKNQLNIQGGQTEEKLKDS